MHKVGGLGERCKLPQRSLGRSFSGNRILCILALKSDVHRVASALLFSSENQLATMCQEYGYIWGLATIRGDHVPSPPRSSVEQLLIAPDKTIYAILR